METGVLIEEEDGEIETPRETTTTGAKVFKVATTVLFTGVAIDEAATDGAVRVEADATDGREGTKVAGTGDVDGVAATTTDDAAEVEPSLTDGSLEMGEATTDGATRAEATTTEGEKVADTTGTGGAVGTDAPAAEGLKEMDATTEDGSTGALTIGEGLTTDCEGPRRIWGCTLVTGLITEMPAVPFGTCVMFIDAKSKECRDTFHSCSNWSSAGMCHDAKFGFVMRGGCSKTCGFCKGEVGDGEMPSFEMKHQKRTESHVRDDTRAQTSRPLHANKDTSSTTDKPKPTKASVLTTVTTARIKKESGVDSTIPPYKKDGCVDVFPKCAEWKKNSNMCSNPKLAPFLRFGCAKSCAFCSKGSAITTPSPPTVPIPSGKSGEAAFIDHDSAVEMGIAKEIGQNDKKSKLSNHASEKTAKSSKQIYVLKREDKEPDSKRVEIETGDDTGADPVSSLSRLGDDLPKILKGSPDSVNLAAFDDLPEAFRGSKLEDKVAGFVGKAGKKKFDYFTEHYSKDPYIAEYQREEWMRNNGVMGKPYRRWLKNKKE